MQIEFCNTLLTNKTHFLWYNVIVNKVPLNCLEQEKFESVEINARDVDLNVSFNFVIMKELFRNI